MKKLSVFVSIGLLGAACHTVAVNESIRIDEAGLITVNKRLFTEIPINNDGICQGAFPTTNCAQTLSRLRQRLMKLNPLPAPDFGQSPTIGWQEADKRYKVFVNKYQGDPILNLFQQSYARILLSQYGVGTSKNYPLIHYYLSQMMESHSLDFNTMTQAVSRLKGQIPNVAYSQLVTSIMNLATVQQERNSELIESMRLANSGAKRVSGDIRPEFFDQGKKILLAKVQSTDYTTQIARLHALQITEKQQVTLQPLLK